MRRTFVPASEFKEGDCLVDGTDDPADRAEARRSIGTRISQVDAVIEAGGCAPAITSVHEIARTVRKILDQRVSGVSLSGQTRSELSGGSAPGNARAAGEAAAR